MCEGKKKVWCSITVSSFHRHHLERITSVGPRPVGSHENEVLTVGYLLKQIEDIRLESAAGPHQLTVDVQRPTGTFSIDFLGGFTSFYDRVTNIVVRLEPKGGAQHLMLANCHFDTVANSPGMKSLDRLTHICGATSICCQKKKVRVAADCLLNSPTSSPPLVLNHVVFPTGSCLKSRISYRACEMVSASVDGQQLIVVCSHPLSRCNSGIYYFIFFFFTRYTPHPFQPAWEFSQAAHVQKKALDWQQETDPRRCGSGKYTHTHSAACWALDVLEL